MLSALQPIEFADQIIEAFKVAKTDDAKVSLINILRASATSNAPPEENSEERAIALRDNVPKILEFFSGVLSSENQALVPDALRAYCDIVPPTESARMAADVLQQWISKAESGGLKVGDISHINLLQQVVSSGLSTPETQDQIFAALPEWLSRFEPNDLAEFQEYLCRVVSTADLTDTARSSLFSYLEGHRPDPAPSSTFYHWANAVARVSTGGEDPNQRLGLLADRVRQSQSVLDVASVVVYGPAEVLGRFSEDELGGITGRLKSLPQGTEGEPAAFAGTAVEAIEDYLAGKANATPGLR